MFRKLQYFLCALCLLLGVGCQNNQQESLTDRLRINFSEGDVACLHPQWKASHTRSLCLSKWLFDGLTRVDANGVPQLSGAASYEVSLDGLSYTFALREAKWSDGSPVTAHDYEASWKYALDPKTLCATPELFYCIKNAEQRHKGEVPAQAVGVRALDSQTLLVELAYLCPSFLHQIASPVFLPLKNPEKEAVLFNGAFVIDQWDRGNRLLLKKNPMFWNRDRVMLNAIDISFVQDQATLRLFQDGKIDWAGDPLSFMSIEALADLEAASLLQKQPSSYISWIYTNVNHPILKSKLIRQALSLAFDRNKMENHACGTPLPYFLSFKNPDYSENIPQARELFEKGLKELGLERTSFPVLKLRYSEHPRMKKMAPYLQQAWESALGIKIELVFSDWNTFRSNLIGGNFELAMCNEVSQSPDPLGILGRFSLADMNYAQWTDREFQTLFKQAMTSETLSKRNLLLEAAEQILIADVPVIPIATMVFDYIKNPNLTGYVFDLSILDFSYAKK